MLLHYIMNSVGKEESRIQPSSEPRAPAALRS